MTIKHDLEVIVTKVAIDILSKQKTVTTLEIKNTCRNLYPNLKFFQSDISDIMDEYYEDLGLDYKDTGIYREYFMHTKSLNEFQVTQTEAVKLLREFTGKILTVTFTKKNGQERTINGYQKQKTFISDLGYLNFITDKNEFKQVDPKKIISIINGNYKFIIK